MVGTIFAFALFTPMAPINSRLWKAAAALHDNYVEEIGWTDLVQNVARVYNAIPSEERTRTGILVGNYGEAGAINLLGGRYGLPPAISGTNTNWYRTYPHSEPQTLIIVGFDSDDLKELFESCELVARNTNAYGIRNEESRAWPDIFLCRRMRTSWPEFWRRFRRYG
jgi:hypothetical protein